MLSRPIDFHKEDSWPAQAERVILILAGHTASLIGFRGDLVKCLQDKGFHVVCVAPELDEQLSTKLQNLGVEFHQLPLARAGISPIRDIQYILNIARIAREVAPELVFSYTIKPVIFGSIGCRLAGVTRIYSMVTGLGYSFLGAGFSRRVLSLIVQRLYRIACLCNRKVIFQNPDDKELFIARKLIPHDKCACVNGSGVNTTYFSEKALQPTESINFLLIARLLKDKGICEYVTASKKLRERYGHVVCHLVGGIDENPASIALEDLRRWVESEVVVYHGTIADVRDILEKCHVFVLPSYREGTPRTVLEAMAVGRAVITTEAPGCRETVRHGDNGFMVPVRDSDALYRQMEQFVLNPGLIEEFGANSRRLVVEKYDVNKVNQQVCGILGV